MGATDLSSQVYLLMGVYALTALIWVGCALTAFAGYRAFKLRVDLGWTAAFLLLAFVRAVEAYAAYVTLDELQFMGVAEATATELTLGYRISLSALEIIAAFAVFFLFRARGAYFRRQTDLDE